MSEGIKKFAELLNTDEAFRAKLKAAAESYNGEKTDEAVFSGVLVPLAAEYGITATFEEFQAYMSNDQPISDDEVKQIAGGDKKKGYGMGGARCYGIGIGVGGAGGNGAGGGCFMVGGGMGSYECYVEGITDKNP